MLCSVCVNSYDNLVKGKWVHGLKQFKMYVCNTHPWIALGELQNK